MAIPLFPIDGRLLGMIVHDIRNPLNVIGLTVRVIEQMAPLIRAELEEDLGFLRDNASQIEAILALLSDLCRINEENVPHSPYEFNPGRFIEDLLTERAHKGNDKAFPARLEQDSSTPSSVILDPVLARIALLAVLTNAASATDFPLQVRTAGNGDRWTISISVEKPPPRTVVSHEVKPDVFQRLIGSPAERRGLDLAIASWISAQFGGTIRLEVVPETKSTIVIDWPVNAGKAA